MDGLVGQQGLVGLGVAHRLPLQGVQLGGGRADEQADPERLAGRCAARRDSPRALFTSLVNRLRPRIRPYSSMSWWASCSSFSKSKVTASADWGTSAFSVSVVGSSKRSSTAQWTPSRRCSRRIGPGLYSRSSREFLHLVEHPMDEPPRGGQGEQRPAGEREPGADPDRPLDGQPDHARRCVGTPPPARARRRGGEAPVRWRLRPRR